MFTHAILFCISTIIFVIRMQKVCVLFLWQDVSNISVLKQEDIIMNKSAIVSSAMFAECCSQY